MHLVQPLAAGIKGAENGSVLLYKRGTSTLAETFEGFDASGPSTPTGALPLDGNGGAVVYVNELVDCAVMSAVGSIVREFTDGEEAPAVEVISPSFTGTDYDSGAKAVSKPTTLQAVLDAWVTSAGAPDFNVLVSGATRSLQSALSSVVGIFINVKDATYGAVGDGATDDTSQIQAALNVAGTVLGAIVFFPKGTYKISAALSVPAGVSIMGEGPYLSAIQIAHATADGLVYVAGNNYPISLRGMRIESSIGNSGKHVNADASVLLNIEGCNIGSSLTTGYCVFINNSTVVTAIGCQFYFNGTGGGGGAVSALTGGGANLTNCTFKCPTNLASQLVDLRNGGTIIGCRFVSEVIVGGAGTIINLGGAVWGCAVYGCKFGPPSANIVVIQAAGLNGFFEAANTMGASTVAMRAAYGILPGPFSHIGAASMSRDRGRQYQTVNTTPVSLSTEWYAQSEVRRTTNANQTLLFTDPNAPGERFALILNNDEAAVSGTITIGGTNVLGLAPFTVNANLISTYFFEAVETVVAGGLAGKLRWMLCGSLLGQAP